jgi:stearoyl-CoA desaturase (delta-9 desaturase)
MPRAQVDLENLHAVISNRYDVMAKYAQSLKQACREEIDRLKTRSSERGTEVQLAQVQGVKRWVHRDLETLSEGDRKQLSEALAHSQVLAKLHEMRVDLTSIWDRSSASREQLLAQLQDWCKRAEESGIRTLQEFSLHLKSYV